MVKKITTLSANGTINKNSTKIITNDSDVEIILNKGENTLLKLKNIDLALASDSTKNTKTKEFPNIDLELKNSIIKLDKEHQYRTSWANIHIKDSKVSFEGEALDLDLPISKKGKKSTVLTL